MSTVLANQNDHKSHISLCSPGELTRAKKLLSIFYTGVHIFPNAFFAYLTDVDVY